MCDISPLGAGRLCAVAVLPTQSRTGCGTVCAAPGCSLSRGDAPLFCCNTDWDSVILLWIRPNAAILNLCGGSGGPVGRAPSAAAKELRRCSGEQGTCQALGTRLT
ncbi:hypothetical protein HaLaN_17972 [Haematococcus lacustris]|uniref:Uncharacterized protein n=1 Tax=Haematococcus lacustris TaxID=44745 RepID=A0A699ZDV3_HAELA|nr:hypothetical protein HaLaN_17972 [Haematococcus lacustris]